MRKEALTYTLTKSICQGLSVEEDLFEFLA
jgi:hypothetical protein